VEQENVTLKKPDNNKNNRKATSKKPPKAKEIEKDAVASGKANAKDSIGVSAALRSDSLIAKNIRANKDSIKNSIPVNKQDITDTSKLLPAANPDSLIAKNISPGKDSLKKTLAISTSEPANDSANRYLQAYHHVRIFSDSLQAVSDSLFYSAKDSIFRLFTNPIVWANTNQITGDTIYLFTKNKKASRLYVFENGLVINKVGTNLYNQIKGTTLNGYFKDGVIDYMRAKGNAESIYYAQDDNKAFFGVNQSKADVIDMIFLNKDLNKVILRNDAEGTMYPIKKVNFDDMRLRNFKWLEDKRPKSKYELFGQ
jgi:hypothetical protein